MTERDVVRISTPSYDSYVTQLTPDLAFMDRHHFYPRASTQIDTYASLWLVGVVDIAPGQLRIRDGADLIQVKGPIGVFVPPFSIVEFRVEPGLFKWKSYASELALPSGLPRTPSFFQWTGELPLNSPALFEWLRRTPMRELRQERIRSVVAMTTKAFIDSHFTDDLKIGAVANALGYSRVVMSREFKRCYGISPVVYRHKLRLFEAIRLMSGGADVTTATFAVGFSSSTRFIEHFKTYLGATPRQYGPRRKAVREQSPTL